MRLAGWCLVAVMGVMAGSVADAQMPAQRLSFHPLLASQYEPRMGVEKALDENFLTLNIGNSVDLFTWRVGETVTPGEIRAGADFFTWSHLLSGNDFRFPVQAIDYYFGFNGSWVSSATAGNRWSARLRLAHISAHAVDGAYDNYTHQWTDREPFTYSREFVDALLAREIGDSHGSIRALVGGTVLLHSIPAVFAAVAPHVGVELHGDPTSAIVPFIAYDGRLQRIDAWRASHALHVGGKIGNWDVTGVELYAAWESGESMHGELYDLNGSHYFLGVNVVF